MDPYNKGRKVAGKRKNEARADKMLHSMEDMQEKALTKMDDKAEASARAFTRFGDQMSNAMSGVRTVHLCCHAVALLQLLLSCAVLHDAASVQYVLIQLWLVMQGALVFYELYARLVCYLAAQ